MLELKAVFDGYDESKDGKVSLKEFSAQLNRNKKQVAVGVKSTREERRAAEGISLAGGRAHLCRELASQGPPRLSVTLALGAARVSQLVHAHTSHAHLVFARARSGRVGVPRNGRGWQRRGDF